MISWRATFPKYSLCVQIGNDSMASTALPIVAFAIKQGLVGEEVHGADE